MSTVAQSLTKAIPGLFRERANDPTRRPQGIEVAPLVTQNGRGEYQIITTDLRLNEQDASQGAVLSDSADFSPNAISYSTVSVATKRFGANSFLIPERVIQALEGNNAQLDLARNAMNACADQLYGRFIRELVTEATAGLTATTAGTLDLSSPGATDLVDFFNTVVEEIMTGSSLAPNYIYMGPRVRHALRNMDTIQGGAAVAATTAAIADRARTGYVGFGAIEAFFGEYGVRVLTEPGSYLDNTGAAKFLLNDKIIVGRAEAGGRSALHTFVQRDGDNGDLIKFYVGDTVLPQVPGIQVAADMRMKVEVTDPELARVISVTL